MRVLTLDDTCKEKVKRVIAWANPREHWYVIRDGKPVGPAPGDHPEQRYRAQLDTFRCVFSYTLVQKTGQAKDQLFRELSISVPGSGYANVFAAFTIAQMFGFTGWDGSSVDHPPKGWFGKVDEAAHAVVLAQEIANVTATT